MDTNDRRDDEHPAPIVPATAEASSEQVTSPHRATDAEEALIVEAWSSGKYPTKERCLKALGLERLNNAALWKRVKRAMDRSYRKSDRGS
jgi:hypothetical protein